MRMSRFSVISKEIKHNLRVVKVCCRSAGRDFYYSDFTISICNHGDKLTLFGFSLKDTTADTIESVWELWIDYLETKYA